MRIMVTGGAGFIGSHYVRGLLKYGVPGHRSVDVTVLDSLTYAGRRANLPVSQRLTFVHADITDRARLRHLLPGHEAVVHLAAESHVDRSIEASEAFVRTNALGTETLLSECLRAGIERVVHVSTDEVYGSTETGTWSEDAPLLPNSPYAASKAAGDHLARAYWRTHGLDVRVLRPSNNYGPRQHPEKLIPLFTTNLSEGLGLPLYGDGTNIREWLHVDDHCRALDLVLTRGEPGRVYNVRGDSSLSNLEVAEGIASLHGVSTEVLQYVTDRKGHDRRYALDDTRIRAELGFTPQVPFFEGLERTVAWYTQHPDWWKSVKHGDGQRNDP